jgi:hypothetical protein
MRVQNKILILLLVSCLFSGCAVSYHPLVGGIYTANKGPLLVTESEGGTKEGIATSKSILGFCSGDSSIGAAAKNGNISKIMAVDTDITSVLFGIYVEYTTIVRGQ